MTSPDLTPLPVARASLRDLKANDSNATLVKTRLREAERRGIQARVERDFEELDYSELMATVRGKG